MSPCLTLGSSVFSFIVHAALILALQDRQVVPAAAHSDSLQGFSHAPAKTVRVPLFLGLPMRMRGFRL
jgi:hypothetical protein